MSTLPPKSPIQRLDANILYHIIDMNANMFDDDTALDTTLSTSRVCHAWRTFMLGTPSLWAHLIDLDHLHGLTGQLCRELIRRSGEALLRVKTRRCAIHGMADITGCTTFVLDFLGENLGRIQKVEAAFDAAFVDSTQWRPLCLPAPHLESLKLIFPLGTFNVEPPFLSLFNRIAPMLREFRSQGFITNLATPWLHQLHSVELSARLTVFSTLEALMSSKTLVNLRLDHLEMNGISSRLSLPFVLLPKLANLDLNLYGNYNAGTVFLDHIQIPATCSVKFEAQSIKSQELVSTTTLCPAVRTISTYAKRYFTEHTPTKILLEYSNTHFTIEDQTHPDNCKFKFSMRSAYAHIFPLHTYPILLSEFTLPEFAKVTQLEFGLRMHPTRLPVSESIAFMACLPSIHTLIVDPFVLQHLMHIQETFRTADVDPKSVIAFPALKILNVHPLPGSFYRGASSVISEFILARITHALAIDILDISRGTLQFLPDMSCFRKADGLKVVWRWMWASENAEYICGIGCPTNQT